MVNPSVAVCRPTYKSTPRLHDKCIQALIQKYPNWIHTEHTGPCVDIVRAELAEDALRKGVDVLLWIDSDVTFSPETCREIISKATELYAVVGCAYAEKTNRARIQAEFDGIETVGFFRNGRLYPVKGIGFGLVAMPAKLLERIAEFHGLKKQKMGEVFVRPWFSNDAKWETMHSDDFAFCRRAREAGIDVYCDTRHRVGHIGEYVYMPEDCAERILSSDFEISFKKS